MTNPLDAAQNDWIETTLAGMSLEEKLGHLLCPSWEGRSTEEWLELNKRLPLGCMFFPDWKVDLVNEGVAALQGTARIPFLIAADMETGLGSGTVFPDAMACAASGHTELMKQRGSATGREARALGICWSFAPNVDIPFNHRNVETLTRAWSDDPEKVAAMVVPLIQGMQEDGILAATAKHFPGTGMDDRDQHMCTVINPLSKKDWLASYGRVYKAAIDAGVMSIMPGHISLPAIEGLEDSPTQALPATLNPHLIKGLLREELGFEGVIVSDAAVMVGFASRVAKDEMAVRFIEAGGDVFLFPKLPDDYEYLLKAHREQRLSMARIDESVRRVLAMKAKLRLTKHTRTEPVEEALQKQHAELSDTLATDAITVQRKSPALPAKLKPGAKVLTVTLAPDFGREGHRTKPMNVVDEELKRRGFEVEHLDAPGHTTLLEAVEKYDYVFLNLQVRMHQMMGNARLVERWAMNFWEAFWFGRNNVIFTSFGSPYHLYEFPHLPNMVLCYSASEASQRAVVKVWLGEMEAKGKCPVRLPKEAGPTE